MMDDAGQPFFACGCGRRFARQSVEPAFQRFHAEHAPAEHGAFAAKVPGKQAYALRGRCRAKARAETQSADTAANEPPGPARHGVAQTNAAAKQAGVRAIEIERRADELRKELDYAHATALQNAKVLMLI